MKLQISKNTYKASNFELELSSDLKEIKAWSYDWWQFVSTDSVGNVYFNNYSYSSSTSQHQAKVARKLRHLGIRPALKLNYTNQGFQVGIREAINSEINCYKDMIMELIELIRKPRSWKKTNEKRKLDIRKYLYRIKDLRNYRDNYLNKKPIKGKRKAVKRKLHEMLHWRCENKKKTVSFFLKRNGKVDQGLVNRVGMLNTSLNINCLNQFKDLLGLNSACDMTYILAYEHIQDINDMIPLDVDCKEYELLQRFLKRNNITKKNLNLLSLEKIHVYMINKLNRKNYVPSEPKHFPVSEKLIKLENNTEKLRVIKNDRQLKSEGRSQSHCIGGKNYINRCLQGYHALNYKGYTFFLSPELEIIQTNGRHNTYTPEVIESELNKLIQGAA